MSQVNILVNIPRRNRERGRGRGGGAPNQGGRQPSPPPAYPRTGPQVDPFQLYPRLRECLTECLNNIRVEPVQLGVGGTHQVTDRHSVQTPQNSLDHLEILENRQHG